MEIYSKQVEIRWSDLDPNFHLRHSVYYDWGAYVRMCFLTEHGLTPAVMMQHHFGPIIFREEAIFKREIHFGDAVEVKLFLASCKKDLSRWSMKHEIIKNSTTLSAIIHLDGAWMDTHIRKLAIPPQNFIEVFQQIPKSEDFVWSD
ncbi:MAG: thioesterase family protein [Sphingobacteriia bacterium]|nr:thioesterase family protein [Sphingobacteriia bacterium]